MTTRDWTIILMLAGAFCLDPTKTRGAAEGAKEHGPCGGKAGVQCDAGLWCDVKGACDAEDPAGVCVKVPDACTKDHAPVCGCDGMTYENDCERQTHRMQKSHDGECESNS